MSAASTFGLLQRNGRLGKASGDLVTPIQFSSAACSSLGGCKNPVLIMMQGPTGAGKSTRLNQLISGRLGSKCRGPFRAAAGGKGVTTDFNAWGPVPLSSLCKTWKLPKQARDDYSLFFVDSEGTSNANGVDENLGKALTAVSAVITIRIVLNQNRLRDDNMSEIESILKLQCIMDRDSNAELSSAFVLMFRDVGFDDPEPNSLQEMEVRRHEQDGESFNTISKTFPQLGFTSSNLLVLLQPQLGGFDVAPCASESYLESMRDLVRFIDNVCASRASTTFAWMNDVMNSVATAIHSIPGNATINITETVQQLYIFRAEEIARTIIKGAKVRVEPEVDEFTMQTFPYEDPQDPKCISDAIDYFAQQCSAVYPNLLNEIPSKSTCLQHEIRDKMHAEWISQWTDRRQQFLKDMSVQIAAVADELANSAANEAINRVNDLTYQAALKEASAEPFSQQAIETAVTKLTTHGNRFHPKFDVLIANQFANGKSRISETVRNRVEPVERV
jgi:hypothetical protein